MEESQQIVLPDGKSIPYILTPSTRAKRISITVHPDKRVLVRAPYGMYGGIVNRFVANNLHWIVSKIAFYDAIPDKIFVQSVHRNAAELKALKEKATILAVMRLAHFNRRYGFYYTKVTVGNQKSRWGSCSPRGSLRFNYRIALLPAELADYIIVHELCHLGEMNHSKAFWELVAKTIPDHKILRARLKKVFEI